MSAYVEQKVRERLDSAWSTDIARIREPNTLQHAGRGPWIELRFTGARISRADIGAPGAPLWDETGAFMVDVYVPTGTGTALATSIADSMWDLFAGEEFEGIHCDERLEGVSGERVAPGIEGVWWGMSFGIGYRYQSVTVA